ncbi:pyridoxamine 5'-phosphate oxidase family protein [Streptomyces sp. 900116325]
MLHEFECTLQCHTGREQPLDGEVVQIAGDPVPVLEKGDLLGVTASIGDFHGQARLYGVAHQWSRGDVRSMSEEEPRGPSPEERAAAPGDVGRRIAARREELGLTRQDVADRSGSAATYIQYLEEQPAMPSMSFMLRPANALDTTVSELTGSSMDLPPGTSHAGRHSRLIELSADECRALLSAHGVGRISVSTTDGPTVVPVNYVLVDSLLTFRTAAGATARRATWSPSRSTTSTTR